LLGGAHRDLVAGDDLGDLGVGVVEVAGDDRVCRAHRHAGRLETNLHAVVAEVALVRGVGFRVDVDRVVGAGVHTGLATNAVAVIEIDDAVRRAV
jgi:hypothetical protein